MYLWLALPGIWVICRASGRQRQAGAVGSMFVLLLLMATSSCRGGTSNSAGGGGGCGQQSTKYTVRSKVPLARPGPLALTRRTTVDLLITK